MSRKTRIALAAGVVLLIAIALILPGWGVRQRAQERESAAELYQARCAICHDLEGGIGTPLDPRVLASYGNAQVLFNYVRLAMPYESPRTLPDEAYWMVVGHLLRCRGLVDENAVVDEETAEGIRLDGA